MKSMNKKKEYAELEWARWGFLGLFILILVTMGLVIYLDNRLDILEEQNLIVDKEIFNFNVECEGNDVIANVNYSVNSYELYKKMIKIYNTKNCKIYDVNDMEGETNG